MAARPQASIGAYRQHMVEQLFSTMLSGRLDEIAQAPNAPFLKAQTDRGLFVRTEEATTPGCPCRDGRRRTGPGGALHRGRPRRPIRLHRDGAESGEAEPSARAPAVGHREGQEPLGSAGRRIRAQLHPGGTNPGHRLRVRLESALPAGDHAGRSQQRGQGLDAQSQPARRDHRAREGPAFAAHRGEAGGGHQRGQRHTADGLRR